MSDERVDATCSRAGCRLPAQWRIDWRNPRIHTGDRRKTWVACDEHVTYLREFLAARDFPLEVSPLADAEVSR
ncbi:hypothetical protein [Microbacterium jejuense]|uniref:hypothetical protein n=1 Tax=Microbacterium jejuense TaxID=1263637 RepID=UPI0031E512F8